MRSARTLVITACVVFVFITVAVGSARTDAIHSGRLVEKFKNFEEHLLSLPETSRAPIVHAFNEHFENNNGKHLGFSVASAHRGPKFGLFKGPGLGSTGGGGTTPNPEPAAVFLLGTGLATVGAYARRRFKRPSH